MYSIPQHAVTNGYWKIEYLRAQPRAASRRLVKNDVSFIVFFLPPIQGAVVPGINIAHHQNSQKHAYLRETRNAERAIDHGPRIKENELDIEQDKEDSDQIKLDRESSH